MKKPKLSSSFKSDLAAYLKIHTQIKELEKLLTPLKESLLSSAVNQGGLIDTPTHTVKVVEQTRKTISADKLVEAGVTPKQIAKATIETPVAFVRVDAKKLDVG
jgi:hypothetical protein